LTDGKVAVGEEHTQAEEGHIQAEEERTQVREMETFPRVENLTAAPQLQTQETEHLLILALHVHQVGFTVEAPELRISLAVCRH
jgi:hypothetical protein